MKSSNFIQVENRYQNDTISLELALLSGIGARNSIGFGCIIQKEMMYPFGHPKVLLPHYSF